MARNAKQSTRLRLNRPVRLNGLFIPILDRQGRPALKPIYGSARRWKPKRGQAGETFGDDMDKLKD